MTTTLDIILYYANRYFVAERKYNETPTEHNRKMFDKRKNEISSVVSKLSIKQGFLFDIIKDTAA